MASDRGVIFTLNGFGFLVSSSILMRRRGLLEHCVIVQFKTPAIYNAYLANRSCPEALPAWE
jgi:hypothetical protein